MNRYPWLPTQAFYFWFNFSRQQMVSWRERWVQSPGEKSWRCLTGHLNQSAVSMFVDGRLLKLLESIESSLWNALVVCSFPWTVDGCPFTATNLTLTFNCKWLLSQVVVDLFQMHPVKHNLCYDLKLCRKPRVTWLALGYLTSYRWCGGRKKLFRTKATHVIETGDTRDSPARRKRWVMIHTRKQ